mmetsp:Transcript_34321/g.103422  ORF Transcript_34321/g.103422 Transcript_34321/m.103422 type:complete len:516 (+) Transcript_34321:744-2291(+)
MQLPPASQVHLVPGQPLNSKRIYYHLALPHVHCEEVDVTNAEARLLRDLAHGPLLVGLHRVEGPGVELDEVVHGLRGQHVARVLQGVEAPVRHPGGHARAREVPPAADEVDLRHAELAAGTDVLHSKGAVADDGHILALQSVVVDLVEHCVTDVSAEDVFTLVRLLPGQREVAREHADAAAVKLGLVGLLLLIRCHELAVLQPAGRHHFSDELIPLNLERGRALEVLAAAHDLHALDVGVQAHEGHDAVLVSGLLEVGEERVARRPRRREVRGDGVLLAVAHVVGAVLCLQLRGAVGLVHPGRAAYAEHAVEDHEVEVLARREEHGHAQADVAGADDHLRVGVLVRQPLEGLDALDGHLAHDLLVGVHGPVQRPLLRDEADVLRAHGELPGKPLRHLLDGRGALHGHGHLLAGAVDLQRHLEPGRRGLHGARGPPVLVVRERVRRLLRARVDAQHLNAVVPRDGWDRDIHTQGLVWVVLQVLGPFRVEVLRRHGPPHGTAKQQCPGPERGNGLEA